MIDILIADNNIQLVNLLFKELIRNNKQYRLADFSYDGQKALEAILEYKPDVILLDIGMPKINGLSIINILKNNKENYHPYIIVISGVKEYIRKLYHNKNIYNIIDKGKGFDKLFEEVKRSLRNIEIEKAESQLYQKIRKELGKFEINFSSKATQYLVEVIKISYNRENINLNKDIFPIVARKFCIKSVNVKWNVEKNIKSLVRYTDEKTIKEYFDINKNVNLTVKIFIEKVINKIKSNERSYLEIS